ncbi:MAG: hypothetical protein RI973_2461 [Bacteroidota bacterium]|jgi:uncharacterized membrane protein (UPF0127 family)
MSKSSQTPSRPSSAAKKKSSPGGPNRRQIIVYVILGITVLGLIIPRLLPLFSPSTGPSQPPAALKQETMPEPQFQKEGELQFISAATGQAISKIDIERAETDMERQFGLMYRKSMADTAGMLFIFDQSEPQGFWMKNTYIPLDIMFVDDSLNILNIHENTVPMSENSLLSKGNARYVVEVIGGYTRKYGIKAGDRIKW